MFDHLKEKLDQRKERNEFRTLPQDTQSVDFSSNDYLGYSALIPEKISDDSNREAGSTGSRLLSGNSLDFEQLEEKIAVFHEVPQALIFNSGYQANVGLFSTLPQKGDVVLYDEFIHASVKDGMRLSFAQSFSVKHNDLEDLSKKLEKHSGRVYVAVEAVYSMDGDSCPLEEYVPICRQYNAILIVDEAHSIGVYGERGEGLVQHLGLTDQIPVRVITFGKAMGCHGAAVLSNNTVISFLQNYSRSFIYSTALSPSAVAHISAAYSLLEDKMNLQQLRDVITYFNEKTEKDDSLSFIKSDSAIHCCIYPGTDRVKELASKIANEGMQVYPILPPTIKAGSERIRICLHAYNTVDQIDNLISMLKTQKV